MRHISLEQGSEEWKSFRKNKITATDMAPILGKSPFCDDITLWKRKFGIIPEVVATPAMKRGIEFEEEARHYISQVLQRSFKPSVILSEDFPWLMASLDGIDGASFIEIKIPKPENFESLTNGVIPEYYQIQMQTAFACSDRDWETPLIK